MKGSDRDQEISVPSNLASRAARRRTGSFYTPAPIARWMMRSAIEGLLQDCTQCPVSAFSILDPACGDGAFLLEAFALLCNSSLYRNQNADEEGANETLSVQDRLLIVRNHLFGVDIDAAAIAVLRARLTELIGADNDEVRRVVFGNIQFGDSLLGDSFTRESEKATPSPKRQGVFGLRGLAEANSAIRTFPLPTAPCEPAQAPAIGWAKVFPQIAERGGFALVIGNPPYLKERNAKDLFDRIARTDFGRRWREARMDLWFYFVHRSLDLLRPGGRLSFIVNSYWTASSGARKLIERLREETTLEEIVLLDRSPVFADVEGRHLIFRLKRSISNEKCRVLPAPFENGDTEPLTAHSLAAESLESTALSVPAIGVTNAYWLTKQDLFQGKIYPRWFPFRYYLAFLVVLYLAELLVL